jgi:hypothetical protein
MSDTILVTRPKYDDGTEYLSHYASLILKQAQAIGISAKDFEGKEVNKDSVTKFIEKKNPKFIFINGHGDENSLYGHDDQLIFSSENISLLKDKIVYARACNAGAKFGKEAVENNSGCFIGYKYQFQFWIDERWSAKPANDNMARLYLEPSNEIASLILIGKSASEADEKSRKMMLENMKKILKLEEKKEPGAMGMLQVLWNNFDGQVLYGDASARFNSKP